MLLTRPGKAAVQCLHVSGALQAALAVLLQQGATQFRSQWKQKGRPTEPTSASQCVQACAETEAHTANHSCANHSSPCCFGIEAVALSLLLCTGVTPVPCTCRHGIKGEPFLQGQCSVCPLLFAYSPMMLLAVWVKVLYSCSRCWFQKQK